MRLQRLAALALLALPSLAHAQAFRVGSGVQIVPRASSPTRVATNGVLWIDSGTGNAKYTNPSGTTITLGAGGGGSTLATAYSGGASQTDSTILLDSTRLGVRIRDNASPIGTLFAVQSSAGSTYFSVSASSAQFATASSSGSPLTAFIYSGGTRTATTASTEANDWSISLSNVQWNTGALTTQRGLLILNPTYSFVGASTITNAATVAITDAPSAGTNATIINRYALWIQSGVTALDGGARITGNVTGTYTLAGTPTVNGYGYQGGTELAVIAATNTASAVFARIGDGTTTGYAQWTTPSITVAKTYLIRVSMHIYASVAGQAEVRIKVDGSVPGTHPTIVTYVQPAAVNAWTQVTFDVPVSLSAGTHTIDPEWRAVAGTINVNTSAGGGVEYRISG